MQNDSSKQILLNLFDKDAIVTATNTISYDEMLRRISIYGETLSDALLLHSLSADRLHHQKRVLILSENRVGFLYAFFSVLYTGNIAVPIDNQLDVEGITTILEDCNPSAVWASASCSECIIKAIETYGKAVPVLSLEKNETSAIPDCVHPAQITYSDDQTAVILYTSGTESRPKGVMLSYGNLLLNVQFISEEVPICTPNSRTLILLPLFHILPLLVSLLLPLIVGAGVAFPVSTSFNDVSLMMKKAKIGVLLAVPALWQAFYEGVMEQINNSWLKRSVYNFSEACGNLRLSRLLFRRTLNCLGHNLWTCPCGGSSLSPDLWKGMKTLGIEIVEGYGMTECGPLLSLNRPGESVPGSVGKPFSKCQIRIIDGEICAKGANIMQGYYNRPDETAEMYDEHGWFHTGDEGYFDSKGNLFITGRRKNIIVLSNGRKVNPEEIEAKLSRESNLIQECGAFQEEDRISVVIRPSDELLTSYDADEMQRFLQNNVIDVYNNAPYLNFYLSRVYIVKENLPRTRLGKLQRSQFPGMASKGILIRKEIDNDAPIGRSVSELIDYFKTEGINEIFPDSNVLTDLGLDSISILKFQYFIDSKYRISLTQNQIIHLGTINRISIYIENNKRYNYDCNSVSWPEIISETPRNALTPIGYPGWLIIRCIGLFNHLCFDLKVSGRDNIPDSGQFIVVSNHQSYLDALFLLQNFKWHQFEKMTFLAKKEHVVNRFMKLLARRYRVVLLDKDEIRGSISELIGNIKSGANSLIFPEGTRTDDGTLKEFHPLFAILAKEMHIPILPVCIDGTFDALPKHRKRLKYCSVNVTFLPLIMPDEYGNSYSIIKKTEDIIMNTYKSR